MLSPCCVCVWQAMVVGGDIKRFQEDHSERDVSFTLTLSKEQYDSVDDEDGSLIEWLKLHKSHSLRNMHAISAEQRVQRISLSSLCEDFAATRLHFYGLRKQHQLVALTAKEARARNKARFAELVASGSVALTGTEDDVVSQLRQQGLDPLDGIYRVGDIRDCD